MSTLPQTAVSPPVGSESIARSREESVSATFNAKGTARNVVSTLLTQCVSWGLALAVTFFLPHYAGAVGLGKLAFAASFVGTIAVAVPLGTSTVLLREIARDRSRTAELMLAALLLRLPLGTIAVGIATFLSSLLGYDGETQTLILTAGCAILLVLLGDAVTTALQGQERIVRSNLTSLIQRFAESTLIIVFVLLKAPLWTIAAASGISALVTLFLNLSAFQGLWEQTRQLVREKEGLLRLLQGMKFLMIAGMPFLGWTVAKQLYGYTDPFVLKSVAGLTSVGWYSAAFRLVGTANFIPVAITGALLPTLTRLYREDIVQFEKLARQMFALVVLTALPIAVVLGCCSGQIVALLHYPAEFAGCIAVLPIGGLTAVTFFAGIAIGAIVIASDRQNVMLKSSIAGAVIGIPLCIGCSLLGNIFWKNAAVGAMASDGILELILIALYVRGLSFPLFDAQTLSWLARCAVAAVTMTGFLVLGQAFVVGHLHIDGLWMVLPALMVYTVGCVLLRCIDSRWLQLVKEIRGGRSQVIVSEAIQTEIKAE